MLGFSKIASELRAKRSIIKVAAKHSDIANRNSARSVSVLCMYIQLYECSPLVVEI